MTSIDPRILLASTFMDSNPIHPYQFHPYCTDGVSRGKDYRYHVDFNALYPDAPHPSVCYLWGCYVCSAPLNLQATLIAYGPVQVFVNGLKVAETNVQEERFRTPKSVTLPCRLGRNDIVLCFEHTDHGFGGEFGTWVGKLDYWFTKPTALTEEGFFSSHPVVEKLPMVNLTSLKALPWVPQNPVGTSSSDIFDRLIPNGKKGDFAVAYTAAWTKQNITLKTKEGCTLYVDGKETTTIPSGDHKLRFIVKKGDGAWGLPASHRGIVLHNPLITEKTTMHFCVAGPFASLSQAEERTREPRQVFKTKQGTSFWRLDRKDTWVRMYNENALFGHWSYPLGVTLYGLCVTERAYRDRSPVFARKIHDYLNAYLRLTITTYPYALWDKEQFGGATAVHHLLTSLDSLDDCGSFCSTLLEIAKDHELPSFDPLVTASAEHILHKQARTEDHCFFRKNQMHAFHNGTMWADDLYMSVPFLVRYASYGDRPALLEDAANQFIGFKKRLYMPEEQLFSHVYDFTRGFATGIAWGRGNGWVLFSLSELLAVLPDSSPSKTELITLFQELAKGVLAVQDEQGFWHQVLDMPSSYKETSCTAMFTAAFMRGLRNGWLTDDAYEEAARKGAEVLQTQSINERGHLLGVCRGSEFSCSPYYYAQRLLPRIDDPHGIGIVLIALDEVEKGKKQE